MKTVRLAAAMLLVYTVSLVAMSAVYGSKGGVPAEVAGALIRLLSVGLVASGLWRGRRWAWWFSVIVGSLVFVLGLVSVARVHAEGVFEAQPHFVVIEMLFALALGSVLSAVVLLLLPESRAAMLAPT